MSDSQPPRGGGSGAPPPAVDYGDPALLPHDSAGPEANAVAWSLLAVAGAFLGLRLYCKYLGRRGLWWDDRILIASWVWTHAMPPFTSVVLVPLSNNDAP
jgi:hypothetical protein